MLKDGTYDGEARGMAGFVKAKLTIKDQKNCCRRFRFIYGNSTIWSKSRKAIKKMRF
ncbi:hypothetical protein AAULH_05219 [Lactobacillus helveticus MTCC 5463]|nr:hypothetical protein AAULH_05219 [Lactobacillus helveticus MTCC 5463]